MFAPLASVTPSYRQLCVCEMQNSTLLITFLCGRSRQEAGVEITLWCCFVSLVELEYVLPVTVVYEVPLQRVSFSSSCPFAH